MFPWTQSHQVGRSYRSSSTTNRTQPTTLEKKNISTSTKKKKAKMPLDFYYLDMSPPCRAVMLTARAVGVDLNLKLVNIMTGDHRKPEFLKINPQHKIPFLVDGTVKLSERYTNLMDFPWAAGNKITIADFCLVATISTIDAAGVNLDQHPRIVQWLKKCQTKMVGYKEANGDGAQKFGDFMRGIIAPPTPEKAEEKEDDKPVKEDDKPVKKEDTSDSSSDEEK
ncbi:glutathione S-transferase 1-like [Penaeus chinensis]|uniref:glutathione S-transferase 1-like n=1 Tax=Penaeus chinensis TaxID=139456 RepID=UPI001FB6A43D|nr:glutathione S-transferase 1-like [Penaeus chinensis]